MQEIPAYNITKLGDVSFNGMLEYSINNTLSQIKIQQFLMFYNNAKDKMGLCGKQLKNNN